MSGVCEEISRCEMSFEYLPTVDDRQREPKEGEYSIVAVKTVGLVVCYVPGLRLIDFYRTSSVLAKDVVPPPEPLPKAKPVEVKGEK